jgi:DNA repair exonuclease SbcCD ATPase subunit
MHRSRFLALSFLLISPAAFAQSPSTDSQTLQALLAEVRQLRQELRTTTVAAQRVQILLYRLQLQEAAVERAQRRADDARSALSQTQAEVKMLVSGIKQTEDKVSNAQNPVERKRQEDLLATFKAELESQQNSEQQSQTRESEAEQDLRAEQTKLNALQDQLDRLDESLEDPNQ